MNGMLKMHMSRVLAFQKVEHSKGCYGINREPGWAAAYVILTTDVRQLMVMVFYSPSGAAMKLV